MRLRIAPCDDAGHDNGGGDEQNAAFQSQSENFTVCLIKFQ